MHVYCVICLVWTPFFRSLGLDGSQGQVQTRQVQITWGNGGALEIEDGEVLPVYIHGISSSAGLSTIVIAVFLLDVYKFSL